MTEKKTIKKEVTKSVKINNDSNIYFVALTDGIAFCGTKIIKSVSTRGYSEIKMNEIAEYILNTIKIMIKWLGKISNDLEEKSYIVLRPHPTVSIEEYESLFVEILGSVPKNIIISKSLNAQKWLAVSKVYFTNYSTLLLDADALGIPTFIIQPIMHSEYTENYWWVKNRSQIMKYSELKLAVFDKNKKIKKQTNNYRAEYFDGDSDAIEITSEHMSEITKNVRGFSCGKIDKLFILAFNKRLIGSLIRKILMISKVKYLMNKVKKGLTYDFFKPIEID